MNTLLITTFVFLSPVVLVAQTEVNFEQPFTPEIRHAIPSRDIVPLRPFRAGIRDVGIGSGASYTEVELYRCNAKKCGEDEKWIHVASNVTNANGIVDNLVTPTEFPIGLYKLILQTGRYYEARNISTFYPYVEILFKKSTLKPLLIVVSLSPFGYSYDKGM